MSNRTSMELKLTRPPQPATKPAMLSMSNRTSMELKPGGTLSGKGTTFNLSQCLIEPVWN